MKTKSNMNLVLTFFLLLLCSVEFVRSRWQDNLRPRMFLQPMIHSDYEIFEGNKTDLDHFGEILVDGAHILIGSRNIVYKLNIDDLKVQQTLEWNPSEQDKNVCLVKGKSQFSCQNYIKVLKKNLNDAEGRYLICGTNAFKPECREYIEEAGSFLLTKKIKGVGMCPYSPEHNSTAVLVDDKIYAGTAADFQGVDPIIYREPLRTPQFDSTYLNNPSFVGSFEDGEFVFFFFREEAVEYMNCGKFVVSRVARICKNDYGGTRSSNSKWTSFLKARLNCSVPGNYPFYFDEIQDISKLIKGTYGEQLDTIVYGVFTTSSNSIGGSAVCSYRLSDISDVFDGQFKEQMSSSENWFTVEPNSVPSPRPGSCIDNSKELPDANLDFIKAHPLMSEAVPPFFGTPVLTQTGNSGFTSIDVDAQVTTPDGSKFDVIFVGTSLGQLLKAINSLSTKSQTTETVLIEEIEATSSSVKSITVINNKKDIGRVIVTAIEEIKSFPLYRCEKAENCHDCVALQDPYCAWDVQEQRCKGAQSWATGSQAVFLQSIPTGKHSSCPEGMALPTMTTNKDQIKIELTQPKANDESKRENEIIMKKLADIEKENKILKQHEEETVSKREFNEKISEMEARIDTLEEKMKYLLY